MDNLVLNLGNLIKSKRKEKGYSTQELAKLIDASPGLINNIENAKTDTFNIDLLYKLSSILELPVIDMISYDLDTVLSSILDNSIKSSIKNMRIKLLFKALVQLSNNKNCSKEKLDMFLSKLVEDVNFYNKISSS